MKKYKTYQEYVIKNDCLVGEFEQMYRDHPDPWHQMQKEEYAADKRAVLGWCARLADSYNRKLRIV